MNDTHNYSWSDKSEKDLIEPKPVAEWKNQELKIIAGCLQRIAKSQARLAEYPDLYRENQLLRNDNEYFQEKVVELMKKVEEKEKQTPAKVKDLSVSIEFDLPKIKNNWWQFWK